MNVFVINIYHVDQFQAEDAKKIMSRDLQCKQLNIMHSPKRKCRGFEENIYVVMSNYINRLHIDHNKDLAKTLKNLKMLLKYEKCAR